MSINNINKVKEEIKKFIEKNSISFNPEMIGVDTPLFSSGIFDSTHYIRLIFSLEKEFNIKFSDHMDIDIEALDTIELIYKNINKCIKN